MSEFWEHVKSVAEKESVKTGAKQTGKSFAVSQAVSSARLATGNIDTKEYGRDTACNAASAVAAGAATAVGGPVAGVAVGAVTDMAVKAGVKSGDND